VLVNNTRSKTLGNLKKVRTVGFGSCLEMMTITGLLCQSCQRHNSQRDGLFSHNIVIVVTGWPYVGVPLYLIFIGSPVVIEYGNLIIDDLHSPRNDPDPGTDRSETARPGTTELVDFEAIPPFHLVIYLSMIRHFFIFAFFTRDFSAVSIPSHSTLGTLR